MIAKKFMPIFKKYLLISSKPVKQSLYKIFLKIIGMSNYEIKLEVIDFI